MRYKVVVTETALAEANEYSEFIRRKSNDNLASDQWWNGLLDFIFSLENLPARCPVIPEQDDIDFPVHQLLYQKHRIVFQIQPHRVEVLRISHAARKRLTVASLRPTAKRRKPS